jgi:hypothetical protein
LFALMRRQKTLKDFVLFLPKNKTIKRSTLG